MFLLYYLVLLHLPFQIAGFNCHLASNIAYECLSCSRKVNMIKLNMHADNQVILRNQIIKQQLTKDSLILFLSSFTILNTVILESDTKNNDNDNSNKNKSWNTIIRKVPFERIGFETNFQIVDDGMSISSYQIK